MINIEKSKLHNKAMRTREAAIVELLRRPLRDAVTFCKFEKIREPTTAEERSRTQ